jgi:hypothetical protein
MPHFFQRIFLESLQFEILSVAINITPDWSKDEQKFLFTLSVKMIDNSHFSIEERCNYFGYFTKEGIERNCFTNSRTATKF